MACERLPNLPHRISVSSFTEGGWHHWPQKVVVKMTSQYICNRFVNSTCCFNAGVFMMVSLVEKPHRGSVSEYPRGCASPQRSKSWPSLLLRGLNIFQVEKKKWVAQSCPALCDPVYCSSPVSSVHGISQARALEWVTIPCPRGSSQPRDWTQVSCIASGLFTAWSAPPNQVVSHDALFCSEALLLLLLSCFSCVRLCATPWTVAHQSPLSMGFSRQEYWSGLPFPSPGNLPDPGSNQHLLYWQAYSLILGLYKFCIW